MNIILFYLICMAIGLAVDWALYERFTLYVESLKRIEPRRKYRDILFPRIFVTVIGLSLIAIDPYVSEGSGVFLFLG